MSDDPNPRAVIGGNNPPEALADITLLLTPNVLRDQLELDYHHLVERRIELLAGVDRFFENRKAIANEEEQSRAADFVKQLKLLGTDVETARKAEVKPLDAAKAVHQKFFKAETLDLLEKSWKDIEARMTVWDRAEKKRLDDIAAAERKRLADEAAAAAAEAMRTGRPSHFEEAAAAAKKAEAPVRVAAPITRGTASTSSLRKRFAWEEIDPALVPREWLVIDYARIQRAIDEGLRDGANAPAIPGGRIVDVSTTVVR